jgi:transcriptional regulator with XRE-family HTH domain
MNVRNAHQIGLLLRDRRKALGIGQQDFADRLGVSRYWVSQLENGNSGAALGHTLNALVALGIILDAQIQDDAKRELPTSADYFAAVLERDRD